jgi:hypothetical protein
LLKKVLQSIFINAKITILEDMVAAVYAASGDKPAMVCILGYRALNSCYFNGKNYKNASAVFRLCAYG